ncbi:hypothetical protein DX130_24660 [Paenibacillus paeoniae]|uniref:Uncharacterized protein n=1 Tax=Paenibacillus paeoniae TaxID=2292705 RepID=A0A371P212_9BACL|nr:hypothetical protein DX130_24660 [Paenibacillus paeoniae]
MQYSVFKMKCLDCQTVFFVGEDAEEYDKCPMSFCAEGYGIEEDEIIYEVSLDTYTGSVSIAQVPDNPDAIKIR